jgi:hypothetical protein
MEYSARIPFVVRPNERNVLDQRQLEYELVEKYILLCLLHDPNTNLIGWTRNLRYPSKACRSTVSALEYIVRTDHITSSLSP